MVNLIDDGKQDATEQADSAEAVEDEHTQNVEISDGENVIENSTDQVWLLKLLVYQT